jgi:hypothetical protein
MHKQVAAGLHARSVFLSGCICERQTDGFNFCSVYGIVQYIRAIRPIHHLRDSPFHTGILAPLSPAILWLPLNILRQVEPAGLCIESDYLDILDEIFSIEKIFFRYFSPSLKVLYTM